MKFKSSQLVCATDQLKLLAADGKKYLIDVADTEQILRLIQTSPSKRAVQDYRSVYNDIRDWLRRQREGQQPEQSSVDWDDVVFEVDLLKSQEINLDYILELIFDNNKKVKTKAALVEEVRRADLPPLAVPINRK